MIAPIDWIEVAGIMAVVLIMACCGVAIAAVQIFKTHGAPDDEIEGDE